MGERCTADQLRTLFLFERLSESQLAFLCDMGSIESFPPGHLIKEGEPATHLYVMLDGELVMSARMGGIEVETHRTSQRGVYCGAWAAYVPDASQTHQVSIRLLRSSRFFVLAADRFATFMQEEFAMAVHLLGGHTLGTLRHQQLLGQRARLLALGTITAGLTHHLNNPAAAILRAAGDLRCVVGKLRHTLSRLAQAQLAGDAVRTLVDAQDEAIRRVGSMKDKGPGGLEAADREERIGDWLCRHGIDKGWDYAPTFVEAALDDGWLQRLPSGVLEPLAIEWLKESVDAELRIREIVGAGTRMSTLLTAAKQYSQMDSGAYQSVDIHELLRSTLRMFDGRVGGHSGVELVTDWDPRVPEIGCYPGDLNQVWTNIIDNALEAMRGTGRLTVRTEYLQDAMVGVEFSDSGPGINDDVIDHIFTPFFTTKPVGEGSGLGRDLAWRLIDRHGGSVSATSQPGETRFTVRLPVQAPVREG
ncbi:ATP-binding protein [Mycobacterium sp. C31M]